MDSPMGRNCAFTREHFRKILDSALKEYDFQLFRERNEKPGGWPRIFLRHDIDHSLNCAEAIAIIESTCHVRATYFVQLHSEFYNPLSASGIKILRKIMSYGHEVGFHYDLSYYVNNQLDFNKSFLSDKNKLEDVLGREILSIAQHYPHYKIPCKNESSLSELFLFDAYSDTFVKDLKYISDSCHSWREGCLCRHLKNKSDMHVLMHPVWWTSQGDSWQSKLEWSCQDYIDGLWRENREVTDYYEKYLASR